MIYSLLVCQKVTLPQITLTSLASRAPLKTLNRVGIHIKNQKQ